ncbi:hypothetical protein HHI36_008510 [Cryptolaemus montrouzieri]|uniref:Beta-N-acetylhexosaminidase n=1 Tax=Cryptolaemus montrouzieri TaxID=559131 RepID=A0ABD2MSP5_9CUCU
MKKQRTYVAYRKVYSWLVKYVVLLFICALFGLCSMYIYFFYSQSSINWIPEERTQVLDKVKIPIFMEKKYVHLDLKGAPPKVSYYQFFFSLLSNIGATGVVIEYEDMFPYEGILKNISALNAYTRENVKFIGNLAKANGLEIIPLIQTFGHLEFVLKLEEFQGLREVPEFPQILCPPKTIP